MTIKNALKRASELLTGLILVTGLAATASANQSDDIVLYLNDPLGSAIAAFDEAGEVCWRETYTPYGQKTVLEDSFTPEGCGTISEERGFTGHTEDFKTDLVYMQQRYYDPTIGRFLSIDPVAPISGDPGSINRYSYSKNSPYRYTDPTGEIPVDTVFDGVSIFYDLGKIAFGHATGNSKLVAEGTIDLAADTAALLVPYVPAGSTKLARVLDNGSDVPKSGPVVVRPPPGATAAEIAQVKKYCEGCNAALADGALSSTGRVSTKGKLRSQASRAAAKEGKSGSYTGHVGHVPDTTWTGTAQPHSWMDLTPKVNTSLGGQTGGYPIGFKPTEFIFKE